MEEKKSEKKKKMIPTKISLKQAEPELQKLFKNKLKYIINFSSENGSLILHEFRLNEGGIKIQN